MASSRFISPTTSIVELADFRGSLKHKAQKTIVSPTHQADLMSMRRHLRYQASVEIDNLDWMRNEFGDEFCVSMIKQVRSILNKEFGCLRVHRYKRVFVIRHRSVEGLISSLLRMQFHAHQIVLPVHSVAGTQSSAKPVTLTWGVGRTTNEAEVERLRRRRQKYRR